MERMTDLQCWVEEVRATRGLSLLRLSQLLGYKSKTSLERVMKERVRERSLMDFREAALSRLNLTQEERSGLERALEIRLYGREACEANEQVDTFLHNRLRHEPGWPILDLLTGAEETMLERYARLHDLRITVLGCGLIPIYEALSELLRRGDVTVEQFAVRVASTEQSIREFVNMSRLLLFRGYSAYKARTSERKHDLRIFRSDVLIVTGRDAEGAPVAEAVHFYDGKGRAIGIPDRERYEAYLGMERSWFEPLLHELSGGTLLGNSVQHVRGWAELERGCAMMTIKPDLPLEQIAIDALLAAVHAEVRETAEFRDMAHTAREREANIFSKKTVTLTILRLDAMENFARTGLLTDHYWALRPFTPEERRTILRQCIRHMKENPAFSIYFLRGDGIRKDMEINCYKDRALLISPTNSDYLPANHHEVMISDVDIVRQFGSYILQHVIREYCMTEAESLRAMERLVEMCG